MKFEFCALADKLQIAVFLASHKLCETEGSGTRGGHGCGSIEPNYVRVILERRSGELEEENEEEKRVRRKKNDDDVRVSHFKSGNDVPIRK